MNESHCRLQIYSARSASTLAPTRHSGIGRRQFLQAATLFASGVVFADRSLSIPANPNPAVLWYRSAYRRNVIDMHITDWNAAFLSEFNPQAYVENLRQSGVQSAVVYAQSHVGLCNFATKVGRTHEAMKDKDHLKQVIRLCRENGIAVQLYFSVIFDRWAYEQHPEFRIMLANGREASQNARQGLCCPNSPYRDYALALVDEICTGLDFDGIRFDMTFWPAVCCCRFCRRRFDDEVGGELPTVINWEDPHWVNFQRKREEWLAEFAGLLTSKVKNMKAGVTVEHQASTYPLNWRFGVTERLVPQNDFLQGDFYGDALQGSFVRKLFYNLSPNLPYGFETSVMVSLRNHNSKKSKDLMRNKAFACLADGGAFVFIDAIDPVGTLNRSVYVQMGEVFNETKVYEPYLGGKLCQDVAIYLSLESKFDFADNGKPVDDPQLSMRTPHVDAALGACRALSQRHIPYGVITKKGLAALDQHKILVLPNILMMDQEEVEAIRRYVLAGGAVYASKYTSLFTKEGRRQKDFLLADVFGASHLGETKENATYMAPLGDAQATFEGYDAKYPLMLESTQLLIKKHAASKILAGLVLPYTDPADSSRYASIHSNPPGLVTDHPSALVHFLGKGKAIYVAGELEASETCGNVFINLLRTLNSNFAFEAEAPSPVEVTLFHHEAQKRYLVNLVNFQKDLPNIPADGIQIRIALGTKVPRRVRQLPTEKEVAFEKRGEFLQFRVPRLETFCMMAVDYA